MAADAGRFMSEQPLFGSLFDDTFDKAQREQEELKKILGGINAPTYDKYNPESYTSQGDLKPEDAIYKTYDEDPRLKSAQMAALEKMAGYSDAGLSADDQANFAQARSQAGQLMRSGNAAAMQNAEARGVGGSGLEFAMREMANQAAGEQAQTAGLNQANATAQGRLAALSRYEDGLTNVRGQDANVGQYNTSAVNQFNMANTNARNQAQQYNLQNNQNLSNANVDNRNNAVQYNNQMKGQSYNDQLAKYGKQADQSAGQQKLYAADNAARVAQRDSNTKTAMEGTKMAMGGM